MTIDPSALLEELKVGGVPEVTGYLGGSREAMTPPGSDSFAIGCLATPPNGISRRPMSRASCRRTSISATSARSRSPWPSGTAGHPRESIDAYLEELIVRRELAINFVARNPDYDRLAGCPEWARKTLADHAGDRRPFLYTASQLEAAETHDPLWNASQNEMVFTGRMHNYLRMYWAKKILEWTPDAETAFAIAVDLNDRYEMDGRDPNGYTGIAWAIGGKHDRPWPSRPIFGTVRFMSSQGMHKKIDTDAYINRVKALAATGPEP